MGIGLPCPQLWESMNGVENKKIRNELKSKETQSSRTGIGELDEKYTALDFSSRRDWWRITNCIVRDMGHDPLVANVS